MRPVEMRKVECLGAWEGQTPHRIGLAELDDGQSVPYSRPERRAGRGGDKEGCKGPHQPGSLDVNPVFVAVEVLVSPFGR